MPLIGSILSWQLEAESLRQNRIRDFGFLDECVAAERRVFSDFGHGVVIVADHSVIRRTMAPRTSGGYVLLVRAQCNDGVELSLLEPLVGHLPPAADDGAKEGKKRQNAFVLVIPDGASAR